MATVRRKKELSGEQIRTEMFRDHFNQLFEVLTKREKFVLSARYGIYDGKNYCYRDWEIAMLLSWNGANVKIGSICRAEAGAIRKLRQPEHVQKARDLWLLGRYLQLTAPEGMKMLAEQISEGL